MKVYKFYKDSLLKMVHNPGGDWNPGWGVDLRNTLFPSIHGFSEKWVKISNRSYGTFPKCSPFSTEP